MLYLYMLHFIVYTIKAHREGYNLFLKDQKEVVYTSGVRIIHRKDHLFKHKGVGWTLIHGYYLGVVEKCISPQVNVYRKKD